MSAVQKIVRAVVRTSLQLSESWSGQGGRPSNTKQTPKQGLSILAEVKYAKQEQEPLEEGTVTLPQNRDNPRFDLYRFDAAMAVASSAQIELGAILDQTTAVGQGTESLSSLQTSQSALDDAQARCIQDIPSTTHPEAQQALELSCSYRDDYTPVQEAASCQGLPASCEVNASGLITSNHLDPEGCPDRGVSLGQMHDESCCDGRCSIITAGTSVFQRCRSFDNAVYQHAQHQQANGKPQSVSAEDESQLCFMLASPLATHADDQFNKVFVNGMMLLESRHSASGACMTVDEWADRMTARARVSPSSIRPYERMCPSLASGHTLTPQPSLTSTRRSSVTGEQRPAASCDRTAEGSACSKAVGTAAQSLGHEDLVHLVEVSQPVCMQFMVSLKDHCDQPNPFQKPPLLPDTSSSSSAERSPQYLSYSATGTPGSCVDDAAGLLQYESHLPSTCSATHTVSTVSSVASSSSRASTGGTIASCASSASMQGCSQQQHQQLEELKELYPDACSVQMVQPLGSDPMSVIPTRAEPLPQQAGEEAGFNSPCAVAVLEPLAQGQQGAQAEAHAHSGQEQQQLLSLDQEPPAAQPACSTPGPRAGQGLGMSTFARSAAAALGYVGQVANVLLDPSASARAAQPGPSRVSSDGRNLTRRHGLDVRTARSSGCYSLDGTSSSSTRTSEGGVVGGLMYDPWVRDTRERVVRCLAMDGDVHTGRSLLRAVSTSNLLDTSSHSRYQPVAEDEVLDSTAMDGSESTDHSSSSSSTTDGCTSSGGMPASISGSNNLPGSYLRMRYEVRGATPKQLLPPTALVSPAELKGHGVAVRWLQALTRGSHAEDEPIAPGSLLLEQEDQRKQQVHVQQAEVHAQSRLPQLLGQQALQALAGATHCVCTKAAGL